MFRYVALAWDDRNRVAAGAARSLDHAMQGRVGWQPVLNRSGLSVFVRGTEKNVNAAHPLHASRGIVLGKLFRRSSNGSANLPDDTLDRLEEDRILDSGGRVLIDDYWGRWVAFLPAPGNGDCVLRDPGGALPCYRLRHAGVALVFSWLEDVLALPEVAVPRVDWSRLLAHIALVSLSGRDTVLEGVTQVLPGERASLTERVNEPVVLWDAAHFAGRPVEEPPPMAAERLRAAVTDAVRSWGRCHDPILMRLSGGLDSAIVLSCLDRDVAPGLTCLNYHSPGSNSDERVFARLAAVRAGRQLIELERDDTVSLEGVLDVARTPWPHNYIGRLGTGRTDAAAANRIGAGAMFTGGDGDQLFFEFRDWWGAADYLHVRGLDAGFLPAAMDAARLARLSIWKTLRLALRDRLGRPDPAGWDAHLSLALPDALPGPSELERCMHPSMQHARSLPPGKRLHLQQLLFPTDNYDPYERANAPELVNPLMSQPVIECCLATPIYRLTHGGHGRGLVRMAFADAVPEQIVRRRSKGGMEEHVTQILRRNLTFARELLFDGQLVARGVLDRAKLDIALSGRPSAQTAHTVEVHIYLAIEAWLQRMTNDKTAAE